MENKLPLFSIITPIYNVENYLKECLDSVVDQTFSDFECIMVNDGSTDDSEHIARQYVEKDSRFKLYRQQNQGQSVARNKAINECSGKYILFLDSDDFIKKYSLEQLAAIVQENEPDIVINSTIAYYEESKAEIPRILNVSDAWNSNSELLGVLSDNKAFMAAPWSIVIRRNYLLDKQLFFYPGIKHEDELWIPQVIINAEKVLINENPYYCGRCDRIGSTTQTKNIKKMFDRILVVDKLMEFSEKREEQERIAIQQRCARLLTGIVKDMDEYKDDLSFVKVSGEVQKRISIFKCEKKFKYWALYAFCRLFQCKRVSHIWAHI